MACFEDNAFLECRASHTQIRRELRATVSHTRIGRRWRATSSSSSQKPDTNTSRCINGMNTRAKADSAVHIRPREPSDAKHAKQNANANANERRIASMLEHSNERYVADITRSAL